VTHAPSLPAWFEEELLTFPMGKNDDLVDAASMAFDALPPLSIPDYGVYEAPKRLEFC
jgi:phage terminase large subunit-like protein